MFNSFRFNHIKITNALIKKEFSNILYYVILSVCLFVYTQLREAEGLTWCSVNQIIENKYMKQKEKK